MSENDTKEILNKIYEIEVSFENSDFVYTEFDYRRIKNATDFLLHKLKKVLKQQ